MREGISVVQGTGTKLGSSINLIRLADAFREAGEREQATGVLAHAVDFISETGEDIMVAEAHLLRGKLCLERGAPRAEIEEFYLRGLEAARRQNARSLGLRVLIDLCRVTDVGGGQGDATEMLRGCYRGFSEGHSTQDLLAARYLLKR